jgi:hypothetical protein
MSDNNSGANNLLGTNEEVDQGVEGDEWCMQPFLIKLGRHTQDKYRVQTP